MRSKFLLPLLISGLLFGGAAYAGTTAAAPAAMAPAASATMAAPTETNGTIMRISTTKMTITLSDGWRYHFAKDFDLSGLKVGEKVTVTWTLNGKHHDASAVKAAA